MIRILPYTVSIIRILIITIGVMNMHGVYAGDNNSFLDIAEEIEIVEYDNTVEEEGDFDQKIEHDDDAISSLIESGYNGSIVYSSNAKEVLRLSILCMFSPPPEG